MVLGEFVPKEELKSFMYDVFGLEEDCKKTDTCESLDDSVEKVGKDRMGSTSLIENFGMMLVIFIVIAILCIFVVILRFCSKAS